MITYGYDAFAWFNDNLLVPMFIARIQIESLNVIENLWLFPKELWRYY